MADPDHFPIMEPLDRLTVILYRSGLVLFALSIVAHSAELMYHLPFPGQWYYPFMFTSMALASANVHLYDPRFRWLFPLMSWLGFIMFAFAVPLRSPVLERHMAMVTLSLFYAGASMFAMKEYFCFRIPGLPLVPVLLAVSVLLRWSHQPTLAGVVMAPAALLYLWLALRKTTMPLHYDIGDKSQYMI